MVEQCWWKQVELAGAGVVDFGGSVTLGLWKKCRDEESYEYKF